MHEEKRTDSIINRQSLAVNPQLINIIIDIVGISMQGIRIKIARHAQNVLTNQSNENERNDNCWNQEQTYENAKQFRRQFPLSPSHVQFPTSDLHLLIPYAIFRNLLLICKRTYFSYIISHFCIFLRIKLIKSKKHTPVSTFSPCICRRLYLE